MRKLSLLALIVFSGLLSGCSYSTDLMVINRSDRPVEVRYRVKDSLGTPQDPAIKTIAELDDRDSVWRKLPEEQFVRDLHSHTITVTVAPHTALLVDRVSGTDVPRAEYFALSEIVIRGAYGTIMLHGEQVRKSFAKQDRQHLAIEYR